MSVVATNTPKLMPIEKNRRRAMIVRRWAAYRAGEIERDRWRARRTAQLEELVEESPTGEDALLDELPDLIG